MGDWPFSTNYAARNRYFIFQASLIPVHCLRRNPQHSDADDWCNQIHATLEVVESMKALNSASSKCRDVIRRLCGTSLNFRGQERDVTSTGARQGSPTSKDATDSYSMTNWITEVDTAIYEYDACCDRISSATMGSIDSMGIGVQDWDWGLLE